MGVSNDMNETAKTFIAIMVIGLIGIVFLIIFGNLSGNLGFASVTNTSVNESSDGTTDYTINSTNITLAGANTPGFIEVDVIKVHNNSEFEVIDPDNYTFNASSGIFTGSGIRSANWTVVNITYTTTYKDTAERQSEEVITNLTTGTTKFFSFTPTWFILLAVVLLIIIVISVISVVRGVGGSGGGGVSSGGRDRSVGSQFPA